MKPQNENKKMAIPSPARPIKCGSTIIIWLNKSEPVRDIEAQLHADETAYAATIKADARRQEYARTRWLIRKCLETTDPLPKEPSGQPTWPQGIVGSITHKEGHCGITIAKSVEMNAIGIDAENPKRVRIELADKILAQEERRSLESLASENSIDFQIVLATCFSFKESLFKAHFPMGKKMFYFHDALITEFDWKKKTIQAMVKTDTSPLTPAGSFTDGFFHLFKSDDLDLVITSAQI